MFNKIIDLLFGDQLQRRLERLQNLPLELEKSKRKAQLELKLNKIESKYIDKMIKEISAK